MIHFALLLLIKVFSMSSEFFIVNASFRDFNQLPCENTWIDLVERSTKGKKWNKNKHQSAQE